jgi:hypothetical protein
LLCLYLILYFAIFTNRCTWFNANVIKFHGTWSHRSTSDTSIFRGPCTSILRFVFPIGLMKFITVCYFCHFIHSNDKSATVKQLSWQSFMKFIVICLLTYSNHFSKFSILLTHFFFFNWKYKFSSKIYLPTTCLSN